MSGSPLECAVRELCDRFPSARVPELITRVEARDGQLVFTLTEEASTSYFRWDGALHELRPGEDSALSIWKTPFRDSDPKILTWRPGRRLVATIDRAGEPVILKAYKGRRMKQAHDNQQRLFEATHDRRAFVIARPLDSDADGAAYTMEMLHGEELRVESFYSSTFEAIGRALRQMQESVVVAGDAEHTTDQELERLRILSERVRQATGALPHRWSPTLERAVLSACHSGSTVAVHGDLHDGNLLRIGSRIGLLDFDMLCAGDAALDLANLTAHLSLRALQEIRGATDARAEACTEALRRGFERAGGSFERALEFYRATTFLRLALVYQLRPRWASLAPALVRLAESCLHEAALLR